MEKQELLSKVKENFKKKRKIWKVEFKEFNDFSECYDEGSKMLDFLSGQFDEEKKEKFGFNRLKLGVTPKGNKYILAVEYN